MQQPRRNVETQNEEEELKISREEKTKTMERSYEKYVEGEAKDRENNI